MRILIATLALLAAAPGNADVLVPGTKGITHTFEIRGLDQAPEGTRFFAYPTYFTGLTQVTNGKAFSFYKFCKPRIYATKGDLPVIPDGSSMPDMESIAPGLPVSAMGFVKVSNLPEWSETDRIHTVCKFQGIEDGLVLLVLASEIHYDADGNVVSETHYDTDREDADATDIRRPVLRNGGFDSAWLALPIAGTLALGAGLLRRRRKQVSA